MQFTTTPDPIRAGSPARIRVQLDETDLAGSYDFTFYASPGTATPSMSITHQMRHGSDFEPDVIFSDPGIGSLRVAGRSERTKGFDEIQDFTVEPAVVISVPDARVALVSADPPPSPDQILWTFIDDITNRLRFDEFLEFVAPRLEGNARLDWFGTDAYRQLRRAAIEFVERATDPLEAVASDHPDIADGILQSTVTGGISRSYVSSEGADLAEPFLRPGFGRNGRRERGQQPDPAPAAGFARLGRSRAGGAVVFPLPNTPFVELIWNYWHEEGMLAQTLNHILARFQNRRVGRGHDPLARFDLNPLLPLRNLLWGFAEDEMRRLTVRRRAAEYQYQYGLELLGRAIPPPSTLVERRTQFLEAFHALLNAAYGFFKERDDKTVDADAFPLLSNLREVHLVLSRGAHNQFADLAFVARAEMLSMQYILAQPEMREFLGGPTMVPYDEPWMDRVDTMKNLQGWPEASITHFFELATHGEQIVLSVRHGRWNEATRTRDDAANWALTWRNQIQRYVHAYRTVTGVDLATTVDATMPSQLLARRLQQQLRA